MNVETPVTADSWTVAGRTFSSRLIVGTGKYKSLEENAAASGKHIPKPLVDQLAPGGRLVMPIGDPGGVQELIKVLKRPDGTTTRESLGRVRFVPLIGQEGWRGD